MSSLCDLKKNEFKREKDFKLARDQISKINADDVIKEALYIGKKNSFKKNPYKNILIKDYLFEEIHTNIINSYLESVKDKTIKEIKSELNKKIEEYKTNVKILLSKLSYEIDVYKKTSEKLEKDNNNIKQINSSLIKYNRELIEQINNYEIQLAQNSHDLILQQKDLFDLILNEYSNNNPETILKEIRLAKEGSLILLDNYDKILKENIYMKEKIKSLEIKYEDKIESLLKEFDEYKEDKINEEKENIFKIKFLQNKLYNNNKYQKENFRLHQILYYIYNLLFEEFSLNKNIKIDEQFLNIKESDFEPNVIYNEEIKNYIELMIKTMHRESIDIIFRECVGYLNMIIRKFFPNKKNLRFKPVEMLIEINNFIDKKIKKIKDDKILIDEYKNNYIKLEKENTKINKKLSKENDNYDVYQLTNSNQFSFDNKNLIKSQKSLNLNNQICLTNPNIYNSPYNNKINKNNTINLNINNSNNISLFRIKRNKFINEINKTEEENKLIKTKDIFKKRKAIKTLKPFSLNNDEERNNLNNNYFKIDKKTRNKSSRIFKAKTMKKDINNDKIIKDNGNNKEIKFYNDYKFLIEETNRLFLYRPRMNSYNEKKNLNESESNENNEKDNTKEKEKKINSILKIKNTKIKDYYKEGNNKQIEKRIYNKINNIIRNIKNKE